MSDPYSVLIRNSKPLVPVLFTDKRNIKSVVENLKSKLTIPKATEREIAVNAVG